MSLDTKATPWTLPASRMMPSGGSFESGGENANLFSSGTVSAIPIGVNAPMTNTQVAAAASQAAHFELPSTAQSVVVPVIKIKALVGAASSQNALDR